MPLNTYFLGLPTIVAQWSADIPLGNETRDALLYCLQRAAMDNVGVVVSSAGVPVGTTSVIFVSPRVLELLQYADEAAYQAALSGPDFVHPDDLKVVEDHIQWKSSAAYDARLKRSTGTYRELRIQGFAIKQSASVYRVTIMWPV